MSSTFENHISTEAAYRLICLFNADMGGRDAISARGWIKFSSWYDSRLTLSDGSYIYREPYVDAHFIHSNASLEDTLDMFDIDWEALGMSDECEHGYAHGSCRACDPDGV